MTNPSVVWFDAPMRVAVSVSPPLLADLLRRLLDRAGIEVVGAGGASVDVALVVGEDAFDLDADVTITFDEAVRHAAIVDRGGNRRVTAISGLTELIELVRTAGTR